MGIDWMIEQVSARSRGWGRLFVATLLSSASALPLHAQPAPGDTGTVEEIIVTAQKRSEKLQSVPISIQALTPQVLADRQVTSFDDYAKLLPSVSFQSFGPGQSQLFFRGISSGEHLYRRDAGHDDRQRRRLACL
jgi:outer membrane receptor protein involved in Fe transport